MVMYALTLRVKHEQGNCRVSFKPTARCFGFAVVSWM
jgi:hypothetical protein